ncbi:endonuclease III [Candidatus Woesearchaeota archaeon]|nr:endonuclease III [Candidatus Woesearchaeota archaeon]
MQTPPHSEIKKVLSLLQPGHRPTMLELLEKEGYSPFQLLVATLLSSRTKDSTTIPIVRELFEKYPALQNLSTAKNNELEKLLYGIGFYKTKTKHVKELSKIVLEKYHGEIPETFEELTSLPGVGRKTANCVLGYAFKQPAIAVDTHVHRISNRLGWVHTTFPEETEEALKRIVPKELWVEVNRLLVDHGQRICLPRNPKCSVCSVSKYCAYGKKILRESKSF